MPLHIINLTAQVFTGPLYNKKEGGTDPKETEEQAFGAARRAGTVEELLNDREDPDCVCSTTLGNGLYT